MMIDKLKELDRRQVAALGWGFFWGYTATFAALFLIGLILQWVWLIKTAATLWVLCLPVIFMVVARQLWLEAEYRRERSRD